jgi:hypothetical protein
MEFIDSISAAPTGGSQMRPHSIDLEQQMSQLHRLIVDSEQELRQLSLTHSTAAKNSDTARPLPQVNALHQSMSDFPSLHALNEELKTLSSSALTSRMPTSPTSSALASGQAVRTPTDPKKLLKRAELINRALSAASSIQQRIDRHQPTG